ncbi:MAG: NADH:flavin oxidoreductase [Kiritimatiellae bacterium]|jgi:2,4-dienoyl-CoA reductase-like NADH-dependent reductase (Old Yellow Enzyme family)|nr:NADH:flavin oxidoreductase [Kiritimatiellia bacterium]
MITIFDPLKIKNITLPNRIVRSATGERIATRGEFSGDLLGEKYAALARGGAGLIISGHVAVHPSGKIYETMASIYSDADFRAWRRAIDITHAAGGILFLQLNHGGGRCSKYAGGAAVCVSPLADFPGDPMEGRELTAEKISELSGAFADAALKARELGADGVQIHAAHGYLVSQFLSPLTNRRKDEWGSSLENRARFLRSVICAARRAVGKDFPVGVKIGACDDDSGGLKMEETLQVAKWLETEGLDFIEISGGFRKDIALRKVRPGVNEGYYLPFTARFKNELSIPVFAVGGLRSVVKMNEALALKQCDAIAMSRPLICQPDLPLILRAGGESACRGCSLCLLKPDGPTVCHMRS